MNLNYKLLTIILILLNGVWGDCTGCNYPFNFCNMIINNYDDCSDIDINILQDIIIENDLNNDIINFGYQEWENGRLVSIILINNNINFLPESLGGLSSLEGLDLEFNTIITLPQSIGNLSNLKYLDLSSNEIEYLPDSFFNLNNLKTLGLYNNRISSIQEGIGLLTDLEFINLSFNQIINMPMQICNLENVNWSDHWIDLNFSYLYNNNICPPYPDCIENHIGFQDTSNCSSMSITEIISPKIFELSQASPNPFNQLTNIFFSTYERSQIAIKIYDVKGNYILTLLDKIIDVGKYKIRWDAGNLSSGIYYIRMGNQDFYDIKKIILVK